MIIANRSKKLSIFPLLFAGVLIFCLCFYGEIDAKFIVALIFAVINLPFGLYVLFNPKNAIVKADEVLVVNYLFCKKIIPIKDIEYVSTTERGEYYNRENSLLSDILFFTDSRRLTISYKSDGILLHTSVFIKNASSVKVSIDSMQSKSKI